MNSNGEGMASPPYVLASGENGYGTSGLSLIPYQKLLANRLSTLRVPVLQPSLAIANAPGKTVSKYIRISPAVEVVSPGSFKPAPLRIAKSSCGAACAERLVQ